MKKTNQVPIITASEKRKKGKIWRIAVPILAVAVFICTTAALVMPAVTQSRTVCGMEEHTHADDCYTVQTVDGQLTLACSLESLDIHVHEAGCFDAQHNAICGWADYVAHQHGELCYENSELVCQLPTIKPHTHSDGCYEQVLTCSEEETPEGHTHDEGCYEISDTLICNESEVILHTHSDACFQTEQDGSKTLICTQQQITEHNHSESCCVPKTVRSVVCQLQAHIHTEECFAEDETDSAQSVARPNKGVEKAAPIASGTCGDNLTWTLTEEDGIQTLTISGTGAITSTPWSSYQSTIARLVIEEGVTSICDSAFYQCAKLTDVTIANSVISIGDAAFRDCTSLVSITIPEGVCALGVNAFMSCSSLTSITIPSTLTHIGTDAFRNCSNLRDVYITDLAAWCKIEHSISNEGGLPEMAAQLFLDGRLITDLSIPEGVTSISNYAFMGFRHLTSVTIPDSLTSVGKDAFSSCTGLTAVHIKDLSKWTGITFAGVSANPLYYAHNLYENGTLVTGDLSLDGVTSLGNYSFAGCTGLTGVSIPEGFTAISEGAFYACTELKSVSIPESVTAIGDNAFRGCSKLTDAVIPDGVTTIGNYLFADCSALASVTIPEGVTSIGQNAFQSCAALTSITLPEALKSLNARAFANCSSLSTIYLNSKQLTSTTSLIFNGCSSLNKIVIGTSAEVLPGRFLSNLSNVNDLEKEVQFQVPNHFTLDTRFSLSLIQNTMPEYTNVLSAGMSYYMDEDGAVYCLSDDAAYYLYSPNKNDVPLVSVPKASGSSEAFPVYSANLPVDHGFFSKCGWLLYPDGEESYKLIVFGDSAISDFTQGTAPWNAYSSKIKSIEIASTISGIGSYAFYGCDKVTSVQIPRAAEEISGNAFLGCSSLKAISVEAGNTAFTVSNSLLYTIDKTTLVLCPPAIRSTVQIPNSVTAFGDYAFADYANVDTVQFPTGYVMVGDNTFINCIEPYSALRSGLYYIDEQGAFYWICGERAYCLATPPNASDIELISQTPEIPPYGPYDVDIHIPNMIAYGYTEGLSWYIAEKSGRYTLTISGDGAIPNYASETQVPWYEHRSKITDLSLQGNITAIGNNAFRSCNHLTSVTIPDSVTSIGNYAFYSCSELENITLSENLTAIGNNTFRGCTKLTDVTIPNSIVSIGTYAFYNCYRLTEVNLPQKCVTIGSSAFSSTNFDYLSGTVGADGNGIIYRIYETESSAEVLHLPESVSTDQIPAQIFLDGKTYDVIPLSIIIDEGICDTCGLEWKLIRNDGIVTLCISGDGAMCDRDSYSFPWYNYRKLIQAVNIGQGVSSIGANAFNGFTELTSIDIPDSVASIGSYAFSRCSSLEAVSFSGNSQMTFIAERAFQSCSALTSIDLPDSVTTIGIHAFEHCRSLTTIDLPDSLTAIDMQTFYQCSSLTGITIPDSVTSIGNLAFGVCSALESVNFSDNSQLSAIEDSAFSGCSMLKSIQIPDCVTSIGNYAFNKCAALETVSFSDSSQLSSIGGRAFFDCSALNSFTFPPSVTAVGDYAFYGCNALSRINITDLAAWCKIQFANYYSNPTFYAHKIYINNESVTDLVLPDGLETVGFLAFNGCSYLRSVTIPESVTRIENLAFNLCTDITTVTLNAKALTYCGEVTASGEITSFGNCRGVSHIIIGTGVDTLDDALFAAVAYSARQIPTVAFEGPNFFTVTEDFSTEEAKHYGSALSRLSAGGSYYADAKGALYEIRNGQATLLYVPAGISSLSVPASILGEDNTPIPVTGVASYALQDAANIRTVKFEDCSAITRLADYAFADCPSLMRINSQNTVNGVLSLFDSDAEIGTLVLQNTRFIKSSTEPIKIASAHAGGLQVTLNTLFKPDRNYLYTGESSETIISLGAFSSDTSSSDTDIPTEDNLASEFVRVYFHFSSDDGIFGLAEQLEMNPPIYEKDDLKIPVGKIANSNLYYVDVRIESGKTASFSIYNAFPSPHSGGGTLTIWGELLTDGGSTDSSAAIQSPDGNCHVVTWVTMPSNFNLQKTIDSSNGSAAIRGDGTENGIYSVYNLSYLIGLPNEARGIPEHLGADHMLREVFTDVITLPDEFQWADGVIEAIQSGKWRYYAREYEEDKWATDCLVTVNGEEKMLFRISNTSLSDFDLWVTADNKIAARWGYRSPYPEKEIQLLWYRLYIGDGMITVKDGVILDKNSRFAIQNQITADQYFTYSRMQTDTAVCDYTFTIEDPVITFEKYHHLEKTDTAEADYFAYYGESFPYTIEMSNLSSLHIHNVQSVTDTLNAKLYITAEDMYAMLCQQEEGKNLTITITNASIYKPEVVSKIISAEVTGANGNAFNLAVRNTSGPGTIYSVGQLAELAENLLSNASTITISKAEADGITVALNQGSPVVVTSAEGLQQALDSFGYFVTPSVTYSLAWNFPEGSPVWSGQTRIFSVPATVKDGFMQLAMDQRNSSILVGGSASAVENGTMGVNAATVTWDGTAISTESKNVTLMRDFTLYHSYYQNGKLLIKGSRVDGGGLVDVKLTYTHKGGASYDMLPMTHYMDGAMNLLVRAGDNPHLSSEYGLTPHIIGGIEYYVLKLGNENERTFEKVWIDGYLADSVTVTKSETSPIAVKTLIRWYLEDVSGDKSATIDFPVLLAPNDKVLEYAVESLNSVSWLNDHQTHRLWTPNGIYLSLLDFEKHIVKQTDFKNPSLDVLEPSDYTVLQKGDQVTYRLRVSGMLNQACVDAGMSMPISGSMIMDALPLRPGQWTDATVELRYAWDDDTFTRLDKEGNKIEKPKVTLVGADNWDITDKNPLGYAAAKGQQYIVWSDQCTITFNYTGNFYVYVTLTYPDGNLWDQYLQNYGSQLLTNTFYLSEDSEAVQHSLYVQSSATLNKGVVSTGLRYLADKQAKESIYQASSLLNSRHTYVSNDATDRVITYYVALYNDGYTRLYLNTIHDILPEGFELIPDSVQVNVPNQVSIRNENGKEVIFKDTDVTVHNNDGYIRFSILNVHSKHNLRFDNTFDQYYLLPNEALFFTYQCRTNGSGDDLKVNKAAMPYFDYNECGIELSKSTVTGIGPKATLPNDGSCRLIDTYQAQNMNFKKDTNDMLWLYSDVTVRPGNIVPGIEKEVSSVIDSLTGHAEQKNTAKPNDKIIWSMTVSNSGNTPIIDYVLTDVMQPDYTFVDSVNYEIKYAGVFAHTNLKRTKTLFSISNLVQNPETGVYELTAVDDVFGKFYVSYTPYSSSSGNDPISASLSIRFMDAKAAIPEGGEGILYVTTKNDGVRRNITYTNLGFITPLQAWDAARVSHGDVVEFATPFTDAGTPSVCNHAQITIAGEIFTSSVKTVTEVGNSANTTDCYQPQNTIFLPSGNSQFTYTLLVTNDGGSGKAMHKLILVDTLPEPGDHNILAAGIARFSQFQVDFTSDPNFVVKIDNIDGSSRTLMPGQDYTLEVSSKKDLTENDCNGTEKNGWVTDLDNIGNMRSFRITLSDSTTIEHNETVSVSFTACVHSADLENGNASPGAKAWNSFAYHYQIDDSKVSLSAEPMKVGVQFPSVPSLVKQLTTYAEESWQAKEDEHFSFLIYEQTDDLTLDGLSAQEIGNALAKANAVFTKLIVTVPQGSDRSAVLPLDGLYTWTFEGNAWKESDEEWTWDHGKDYIFYELPGSPNYTFGSFNTHFENGYCYTHNRGSNITISATNLRNNWNIEILKVSGDDNIHLLPNAWFGLYSPDESEKMTDWEFEGLNAEIAETLTLDDQIYYLYRIACSDAQGVIVWDNLEQNAYLVQELQAPEGYHYDGTIHPISREDTNSTNTYSMSIVNESALQMPESGSIGIQWFALPGIGLTAISAVLLAAKKKRKRAEEC